MKFERTKRIGEEIKKTITKMLIEGHIKNSVILNICSSCRCSKRFKICLCIYKRSWPR